MSFELSIRDFDTFGYVFLLKEDQGKTKYSFTYTYLDGENSTFKFNTDGKENHYSLNLRNDALAYQWIPVSFAFDLQQDVLTIRIGDNEKKITSLGLKDTFCPHLFFCLLYTSIRCRYVNWRRSIWQAIWGTHWMNWILRPFPAIIIRWWLWCCLLYTSRCV